MLLSGNEAISNQDVELGDAAAKYKGQCWSIVLLESVWKKMRVLSLDRVIPIDNFSVSKKRSPIYIAKNLESICNIVNKSIACGYVMTLFFNRPKER